MTSSSPSAGQLWPSSQKAGQLLMFPPVWKIDASLEISVGLLEMLL
jgi:hypothetical protein